MVNENCKKYKNVPVFESHSYTLVNFSFYSLTLKSLKKVRTVYSEECNPKMYSTVSFWGILPLPYLVNLIARNITKIIKEINEPFFTQP